MWCLPIGISAVRKVRSVLCAGLGIGVIMGILSVLWCTWISIIVVEEVKYVLCYMWIGIIVLMDGRLVL